MFGFSKKKKIDIAKIKEFDGARKAIEIFIMLSEWTKARKALEEVEIKEKKSLNIVLEKLDNMDDKMWVNKKEKEKLTKQFQKKEKLLDELKDKLNKKEDLYLKKVEKERFKIRFQKVKEEVKSLTWNKKNNQAMWLLQKFLEENAEITAVIRFYNSEKKKILKNKEKVKKEKENQLKKDAKTEALSLIWKTTNIWNNEEKNNENKKETQNFLKSLKTKINFYKNIKDRIKKKKLLDEINLLIEEDSKVKNDIAERKLANIHRWLIKEITKTSIEWYEIYWKILWADKISWDTFGFEESDSKYNFFLWDATGHGIRAWFIVTLLSRLFNKFVKKNDLQKLTYEINNWLKQDLKSRNFITWIFFEVYKDDVSKVKFVWMWHEPMLIYRSKTQTVEKVIAWWLAAWIRIIKNQSEIKVKDLELENGDLIITYSDWIVENKDDNWINYWIEGLKKAFKNIAKRESDIFKIYDYLIDDIKQFRWWSKFDDDASILLIKRDIKNDIQDESSKYLQELKTKEGLSKSDIKKLQWKTIEDIDKNLQEIKKKKETERIIKTLESLYYTWEVLKLKQEAIRFIKEWYIDKKINFYLKKAIENETKYKIEQKNTKIVSKYNILQELLKKWDFDTVIKEIEEIISKDWKI